MPQDITIAAFVFGATLILIALLNSGFKIFGVEIPGTTKSPGRIVAGMIGTLLIIFAVCSYVANIPSKPNEDNNTRPSQPDPTSKPNEDNNTRPSQPDPTSCYDEADANSLVDSLQKANEAYRKNLIDILDLEQHRMKHLNDLFHLMVQGPNTRSCILKELELVGSLYRKDFIDILHWQRSKWILQRQWSNSTY